MTTKATRHSKTPAQRAQETVDILQRRLAKLMAQRTALEKQVAGLASEIDAVQKRFTYAGASPDLPAKTLPPHPITDAKAAT
jgi:chromosome segregation ATPase